MKERGGKYTQELIKSYTVDAGQKFKLREQQYIALAVSGQNVRQAALTLRCSQRTIYRMLSDNPEIQTAIDSLKSQITTEIAERRRQEIEELYDIAQGNVKKMLRDENPWIKLQAMRLVFDRYDKLMSANSDENKIAVVFQGMAVPPTKSSIVEGTMEDEDSYGN